MAGSEKSIEIAMLIEGHEIFLFLALPGLRRFCDQHPEVNVTVIAEPNRIDLLSLSQAPDGILGYLQSGRIQEFVHRGDIPAVSILRTSDDTIPSVGSDDELIGRMAAEYFLGKQFLSFGYFHDGSERISEVRQRGYRQRLREAGHPCAVFTSGARTAAKGRWYYEDQIPDLADWLLDTPRPLALFCPNDTHGQRAINACELAGLCVPDDVAVLAVSGKDILCQFCKPPLSAIKSDLPGIAYAAACWLLDRIRGRDDDERLVRVVPPLGVIERASTDTFPVSDRPVARAMHFIKDHLADPIGVSDLAEAAEVSRSSLERRFRKALGCTPGQAIRKIRTDRALHMLADTDLPLLEIALACGFGGAPQFSAQIKTTTGLTPTEYRDRLQRVWPGDGIDNGAEPPARRSGRPAHDKDGRP